MENSIECSDTWFDVSAKCLAEYWECEGDSLLNWKDRGYKTLFDLLLVINYLIILNQKYRIIKHVHHIKIKFLIMHPFFYKKNKVLMK